MQDRTREDEFTMPINAKVTLSPRQRVLALRRYGFSIGRIAGDGLEWAVEKYEAELAQLDHIARHNTTPKK